MNTKKPTDYIDPTTLTIEQAAIALGAGRIIGRQRHGGWDIPAQETEDYLRAYINRQPAEIRPRLRSLARAQSQGWFSDRDD